MFSRKGAYAMRWSPYDSTRFRVAPELALSDTMISISVSVWRTTLSRASLRKSIPLVRRNGHRHGGRAESRRPLAKAQSDDPQQTQVSPSSCFRTPMLI